ncbi:DUF6079 family protein [Dietzia massiliensis]|uniref:DUF6079 family protein n=1 Tax=Dietzia massiliensis TaxID=2697499 RepID=UPI001BCEB59E|nr:DUF6079 family protein [Dietzia massiliensis]MBS7546548.1 phage resistance protein [Dietzia massiliensis]
MAFTPPGAPAPGTSPSLREIFSIPDHSGTSTFVLQLSEATTADELGATLADYVVTPSIADAFDAALALVDSAIAEGENKGAFLKGSFGSGKSHFMAVLMALLSGNPQARMIPELQEHVARHPRATNSTILTLPFHFLGSDSIEDTLFTGYLEQLAELHPGATPPVLHRAEGLLENAEQMRATVGDEQFFATLAQATTGPDGTTSSSSTPGGLDLAALGGAPARTWDTATYDRARHPAADRIDRDHLISALSQTWFTSASTNTDWLHLPDGLAAISAHAKGLGYEAVVLLLDELILWLTFHFSNRDFFGREIQKLTGFIESAQGRMSIPVVSFIARQHDLKAWKDSSIEAGEAASIREKSIAHQEGRFSSITLGTANLPQIAHRRLLSPKDASAAAALQESFDKLHLSAAVKPVLLDKVNTDDQHRGSSEDDFRLTYPFSPVLIDTLINLSSAMQRDRTALKVMETMLVDLADTMTIDQVIPVGEVFDYIIEGNQRGGADEAVAARFRTARTLWHDKLRPAVFAQFPDQDPAVPDLQQPRGVRARLRLAKTLLLSALAPEVPGLKALTASRLAHLNHGELTVVVASDAPAQALQAVREWNTSVPEITVGTDTTDPLISITLEELPFDEILDRARAEDTYPRRRERLRSILINELGIESVPVQQDSARSTQIVWRGTTRTVEIAFGNVRDPESVPDHLVSPVAPGALRVIVDLPLDDDDKYGVTDDHARLDRMRADGLDAFSLAWLPAFLDRKQMEDLGRLVTIDWVLQPEKWRGYTSYLAEGDRERVRQVMYTQRDQLAGQLAAILRQKYGVTGGETFPEGQPPVRSMDTTVDVQRPVGATLGEAARRLYEQAFDQRYPDHPRFDTTTALTQADFGRALETLRASDSHADGRANFDKSVRRSVALVLGGLRVANVYEAHLVFPSSEFSTFAGQIDRGLQDSGLGPDAHGTVTVGDLTQVIDKLRQTAGLTKESLVLLAAAWAESRDRSWFLHNAPIAAPAFKDIQLHHQLREPVLPAQEDWTRAVRAAQHLFGLPERHHLSPTNLTRLSTEVASYAAEHKQGSEDLVQQLSKLSARLELPEDGARLALARRQAELLRTLATKKDRPGELVAALAATEESGNRYLGATTTEASLSITSAADVAAVARNVGQSLETLLAGRERPGALGADAQTIVSGLATGVGQHEFVTNLATAVGKFEKAAQAWITKVVGLVDPSPPVDPPPPVVPDPPDDPVHPDPPNPPVSATEIEIRGSGTRRHFSAQRSQVASAVETALNELREAHGEHVRYRIDIAVEEDQA